MKRAASRPIAPSRVAHRLPVGTQHLEDARDVGQEAHVEHPVGLVQHADAHPVESQHLPLHEVEQPPRRRDHDVGVAGALGLRAESDTAVDGGDAESLHVGDRPELLGDLARELTGRREDQRVRAPAAGRQSLDDRHREREGLAGAGARPREHVPTGERVPKDERLDREGLADAPHAEGLGDPAGDAEVGEAGCRGRRGSERDDGSVPPVCGL
jgi:hypothetical protein